MKRLTAIIIFTMLMAQTAGYAIDYADLNTPKPPAFRVGLTDTPEKCT